MVDSPKPYILRLFHQPILPSTPRGNRTPTPTSVASCSVHYTTGAYTAETPISAVTLIYWRRLSFSCHFGGHRLLSITHYGVTSKTRKRLLPNSSIVTSFRALLRCTRTLLGKHSKVDSNHRPTVQKTVALSPELLE